MPSYNVHQQVYSLGLASNIATNCTGTQVALQKKMDDALQPSIDNLGIGAWKVVWGPTVWKLLPETIESAADHIWFIARSADLDDSNTATYIVTIAGLAAKSDVDIGEVRGVDQVVDFEEFCKNTGSPPIPAAPESLDPQTAYIALGTATGVYRLLNVASAGQGTTLVQFLDTIPSNSRVIFTGQSLGGTLSSALAPTALKAGMLKNVSPNNVFVYSVSSPTPGNRPFADLFAESFPIIAAGESPYELWNVNIWNKYDIIPHAWNTSSVEEQNLWTIPSLYGKLPGPLHTLISAAIKFMIAKYVRPSRIDYVPIQGKIIIPDIAPPIPQKLDEFIATAGAQHVLAYVDFFGAPVPPSLCKQPNPEEGLIVNLFNDARTAIERVFELRS